MLQRPHVIHSHGTEGNGTKRVFELVRKVTDLPHHCPAHVPRHCIGDELVAGVGHGDHSPLGFASQSRTSLCAASQFSEVKGLADFSPVEDSLHPDGALAVLVLARREFAFREMPTKDRQHSVVKASCSDLSRHSRKGKVAEIARNARNARNVRKCSLNRPFRKYQMSTREKSHW